MAILKPDNITNCNGVIVNEYLLTKHNPNDIAMPYQTMTDIIGITVHNTDVISVASGTTMAEQYTRATVNGNMNDVRVHYYVDNKCAWQTLPLNRAGWHAADGGGNGNRKTIAIECIMSGKSTESDKAAEDNCAKLIAYLLNKYDMNITHLFTHTHWLNVKDGKRGTVDQLNVMWNSYKNCPAYIIPHWQTFKSTVEKYLADIDKPKPNSKPVVETVTNTPTTTTPEGRLVYLKFNTPIYPNAGNNNRMSGLIKSACRYTIVEEKIVNGVNWGRLKSGKGWVKLK